MAYESRLATPAQRLSIEVNVRSSLTSGVHTLSLFVDGAGTAEIKGLQFRPSVNLGFCESLSSLPSTACTPLGRRNPLVWSPAAPETNKLDAPRAQTEMDRSVSYISYRELYHRNLKRLEVDIADAMAVSADGYLYVVFHLFSGLELRKYSPDGSIVYDSVISTCGPGVVSVSGLAIDKAGHAWIAGSETGCFPTTAGVWQARVLDTSKPHGFVILLDTSSPSLTVPRYATYVADTESEVTAIRADKDGNAYIVGTTKSADFPHDFSLTLNRDAGVRRRIEKMSFVSVLNPDGSGFKWSALLKNVELTALALDESEDVWIAGQAVASHGDLMIAEVSHIKKALSYVAYLAIPGNSEGRAISVTPDAKWVFAVVNRESPGELTTRNSPRTDREKTWTFLAALRPCTKQVRFSRADSLTDDSVGIELLTSPALDAFASTAAANFNPRGKAEDLGISRTSFEITAACAAEIR